MAYIATTNQSWAVCRNGCDPNVYADKRAVRPDRLGQRRAHEIVSVDPVVLAWNDVDVVQLCRNCYGDADWTEVWVHDLCFATREALT